MPVLPLSARVALILSLTLLSATPIYAQDCGCCSRPRILLFDTDVQVARPDSYQQLQVYWQLFNPQRSARTHFVNEDPYRGCVTLLDGSLHGDTLRFGMEYSNLPPAGRVDAADYLLYGNVQAAGSGGYTYTLILETAISREVVKSVSVPFTGDPASHDALAAGFSAAEQVGSLFTTISEFEVEKRNSDTGVAIRDMLTKDSPPEIKITPANARLDTGETTDVEIELIDCDGVALANREVTFGGIEFGGSPSPGTTGGTMNPLTVVTDASGKARATFKAGDSPGTASIVAYHVHQKPSGREGAFVETSYISVAQPPPTAWKVTASISISQTYRRDSTSSGSGFLRRNSDRSSEGGSATIRALFESEPGSGEVAFMSGEPPLSIHAIASRSYFSHALSSESINGQLSAADIRTDHWSGYPSQDLPVIELSLFDQEGSYFNASLGLTNTGGYEGKYLDGVEWVPYGGSYDGDPSGIDGGCSSEDGAFTKSEAGYTIVCTTTENVSEPTLSGTAYISRQTTLSATVVPYAWPDKTDSDRATPLEVTTLTQNYPNPFRRTTHISYNLAEQGEARIAVYDALGREIRLLVSGIHTAGRHEVVFDAAGLPAGIYFCRMLAAGSIHTRRLVVVN